MARLLVLFITFVIATIGAVRGTEDLECNRPNEEKRCVAECPPEKTCRTRNILVKCSQSAAENYKEACVCKEGYYRNPGGECATAEDCDKCYGQNTYYSCRTMPDQLCSEINQTKDTQVSPDNKNHSPANQDDCGGNSTQCEARCYCIPGTARDENNECVPYDQCNQPCGPQENKDYCPADCESNYCPKKELRSSCPRPQTCPKPKCVCRLNTRRAENGTCISIYDCPPFECTKPFEEYKPCPPLCPNGNCTQATPDGRCPTIIGKIGILLVCNPQCRCKEGYWWNKDKVCVPYDQCPGKG